MAKHFVCTLLQALVATGLLGTHIQAHDSSKPNVLFIMVDDQDLLMDSLNYMPNVRSQIADKGASFTNHYCTNALCCPSRASLLAGKCVHNTNVTSVVLPYGGYEKFISEGLNDDYLPVWLQDGDVDTYYVGKFLNQHKITNYKEPKLKGWTSSHFLLEPGTYDYLNTTWTLDFDDWTSHPGINANTITTKYAVDMVDKAATSGRPFYLQVSPAIPHVGINATDGATFFPIPEDKYANSFKDAVVPRTPNWNPANPKSGASWILDLPRQNESTVDLLDELYRARIRSIAGLDDMVGTLIDTLDKHGILDNTHIIYTSDNGYHIGQHRLGPGKLTGFETDVNVPLLWRGPGIKEGQTIKSVSSHTDLAPTFLDIFGLEQRDNFDGTLIPAVIKDKSNAVSGEHVNIENWQGAAAYEVHPFGSINQEIPNQKDNTYKGVRLIGDGYSLYYSVWCTNQHELYNMTANSYQEQNLLAGVYDIDDIRNNSLKQIVRRLDSLLMVLKSCVGDECTKPWLKLHPYGQVNSLGEAMNSYFDRFYKAQPRISFSACANGYLIKHEGPQKYLAYSTSATY